MLNRRLTFVALGCALLLAGAPAWGQMFGAPAPRPAGHGVLSLDDTPAPAADPYASDPPTHWISDLPMMKSAGVTLNGWLDGGIMASGHSRVSNFNGPVTYADQSRGQLNQLYLSLERTAPDGNSGFFLGGRVDALFGSDYMFTTAAGLDGQPSGNMPRWGNGSFDYGASLPQAYAEIDYNDLKLKLGHFYTPIGYEVPTSKDNFFYTHSYAMQYAEPVTHTGGLLSGTLLNKDLTWDLGMVSGWNTFNADDRASFLGGLSYTQKDLGNISLQIIGGQESTVNLAGVGPFDDRFMYSLVWTKQFTPQLTYVLQHDFGYQNHAATLSGTAPAFWYGINQEITYKINKQLTAGARLEWFRDEDGFVVTGLRPANPLVGNFFGGNFFAASVGLDYTPIPNLTLRGELRYDKFVSDSNAVGSQDPFDNNTKKEQFLFGIDAIFQF